MSYIGLNKIIKEELSIANDIQIKGNEILNIIKGKIIDKTIESEIVETGVTVKRIKFSKILFGVNIYFTVEYYNFKDKNTYKQLKKKIEHNTGYSSSVKGFAMVMLKCYGISGQLQTKSLSNVLYHEIEHCYQFIKGCKQISIPLDLYDKARLYANSRNKYLAYTAAIIYHSYDFEQDGLINGLYGYLKEVGQISLLWDIVKGSEAYKILQKVKKGKELISNCDMRERENLENCFGVKIDKLIKISNDVYKRLEKKIGKVLIKYRQDCLNENKSLYRLGFSIIL